MMGNFLDAPDDPETVHQFRIKIRSFRSVLSLIKPRLDPEQYKLVQNRMRRLTQSTGCLREIDVLQSEWALLQPEQQQGALTLALANERQKEQAALCGDAPETTKAIFDAWDWVENALAPGAEMEGDKKTQSFACFADERM